MGLKAARFRALHLFPNLANFGRIHGIPRQSPLFQEVATPLAVSEIVNSLEQACADLRAVAVANRLNEEIAKRFFAEKLTENIKDAAT